MAPISITIAATQTGTYVLEDDGVPGNNFSRLRYPDGTFVVFEHPTDFIEFTTTVPGVTLVVNFTDSLGAAALRVGSLTVAGQSPETIVMQSVQTTGAVTLVATGSITEGSDADAAADIIAGSLVMSAGTGIGTPGNALETQTGLMEAETSTGGIAIGNFGAVQIGGISADVEGLDVATSGDITFTNLGSIFLSDATGTEIVHGGTSSGNVTLIANGVESSIIANVNEVAILAPRGSIALTAGLDVQFGTIGTNFGNDVLASGSVTVNEGRDVLIDGK